MMARSAIPVSSSGPLPESLHPIARPARTPRRPSACMQNLVLFSATLRDFASDGYSCCGFIDRTFLVYWLFFETNEERVSAGRRAHIRAQRATPRGRRDWLGFQPSVGALGSDELQRPLRSKSTKS